MQRWFKNNLPDYVSGISPVGDKQSVRKTVYEKLDEIRKHQGTENEHCEGGLYIGVGGVAYMFWKLATSPTFQKDKSGLLETAEYYLNYALTHATKVKPSPNLADFVGFLLGNTGIYAVAALIGKSRGNETLVGDMLNKFAAVSKYVIPVDFLSCGGDELLVGRAGYLSGVLALRKSLNVEVIPDDTVQQIFNAMLISGRAFAKNNHSHSPLMYSYYNKQFIGAAHGLSGIVQIMLSFPKCFSSDPNAESDLKGAVDYILSLQAPNGNFPIAAHDVGRGDSSGELIHWCHGAPGVVYLMAKAFLVWKEDRYLQSCVKCGDLVWEQGLLRKGPGTCHGIAGSGYVFLILYRLTGDAKYLHRAFQFAEFMSTNEFREGATTPDNPFSLYEGLSGTLCFLNDLLNPDEAHFPFFDIY